MQFWQHFRPVDVWHGVSQHLPETHLFDSVPQSESLLHLRTQIPAVGSNTSPLIHVTQSCVTADQIEGKGQFFLHEPPRSLSGLDV